MDRTCPGEHQLPDRPEVRHVITRRVDAPTAAAYLAEHVITLQPGQALGAVPEHMSPDGYLVSTLVTDPAEHAQFEDLMAPDEQLGTIPSAGRPAILLTAAEVGDAIDDHHRGAGDVLFHREGRSHYDVPAQNADREAWLAGRFDPTQITAWTDRLASERARGMVSQRLRILSEQLTADEQMTVLAALPILSREEDVRVLRRGEHPIPAGVIDHDYWLSRPASGTTLVVRLHYSDRGEFIGGEVIPTAGHGPYLADMQRLWSAGTPYAAWMAAHDDLQQQAA